MKYVPIILILLLISCNHKDEEINEDTLNVAVDERDSLSGYYQCHDHNYWWEFIDTVFPPKTVYHTIERDYVIKIWKTDKVLELGLNPFDPTRMIQSKPGTYSFQNYPQQGHYTYGGGARFYKDSISINKSFATIANTYYTDVFGKKIK